MGFDTFDIDSAKKTIIYTLREFFKRAGINKAVLGLSGGIDSAVVLALAAEALGGENVHALLMPSPFSTIHSVTDAVDLADNLNVKYSIIPIEKIFHKFLRALDPVIDDNSWGVTQENIQARIRGTLLMAYSNKHNSLLLNTTNKSELSMGYGTLYGDLCGALMVIADLYKVYVYQMASLINREREIIPLSTLTKEPSAELSTGQKDSDKLPEYSLLDPVLYQLNELAKSEDDLIAEGFDRALVEKVCKLRNLSGFKSLQIPPIIQLTSSPLADRSKWIKY